MNKFTYTPGGIPIGKILNCGCCGLDFRVWPSYRNQDQEPGYGICKFCQGLVRFDYITEIESAFDDLIKSAEQSMQQDWQDVVKVYKKMLFPEREYEVLARMRNKEIPMSVEMTQYILDHNLFSKFDNQGQ